MKLSAMRALLREEGIRLTRSLGQNFLHDANQLRRIVALADLAPGERILEVGPGLGPLTEQLLAAGARVLAVEADRRLVRLLRQRWPDEPRLELLEADALAWLRQEPRDWRGWKLVANLPYSVASPLLVELALSTHPPAAMVVTVQKEVAARLAAGPGGRDYGVLSLLVQARYLPGRSFTIPRTCFHPPPKVESVCLRLDRRERTVVPEADLPAFRELVRTVFAQRRKQLATVLRARRPAAAVEAVFRELGLPPRIRPEAVDLETFARLASWWAKSEDAGR
ncbi:MAG: ribosomal RNA small subunit methyltransferase A [Verrucomicrobia bacterium]|nr:MAG: ribosomal RNA small subunit methyltransferase A [Verrucomicrobiota bacterium]